MPWSYRSRFFTAERSATKTTHPFDVNEQCFIRKTHRCDKMFGASKSCFIACPTTDELEPILGLMSEKLAKVGIEPIIAVKERAYGQDIFCTKICGKIIESRFCVVILDDTVLSGTNIPNPNVYYEYGLMTSLRKHIIPLQKDDLALAFNIQSYDTIKYNARNIGSELDRAIKDAIKITEAMEQKPEETHISQRTIMRKLELAGLEFCDEDWFLSDAVDDTRFRGFVHYKEGFCAFLCKIDDAEEFQIALEDLGVIIYRTEKKTAEIAWAISSATDKIKALKEELEEIAQQKRPSYISVASQQRLKTNEREKLEGMVRQKSEWLDLTNAIYIGFIIDPSLQADDFKARAQALVGQYNRYRLIFNENDTLEFGNLDIALTSANT